MQNIGISRYEKLETILSWKNICSSNNIRIYENKFSNLVTKSVIESKWFHDAKNYIAKESKNKTFYLLTSTPKKEIDNILKEINFSNHFYEVYGWPSKKKFVLEEIIKKKNYPKDQCLMIGDSKTDEAASTKNKISFLLHRTNENFKDFYNYDGYYY